MVKNSILLWSSFLVLGLASSAVYAETIIPSEEAHQLYAAANQLEEQSKTEEAKSLYQQVLTEYPNSPFAPGSHIHLSRLMSRL